MVVMVAELCEYTGSPQIVYFEWVDFVICKLDHNKAVIKKRQTNRGGAQGSGWGGGMGMEAHISQAFKIPVCGSPELSSSFCVGSGKQRPVCRGQPVLLVAFIILFISRHSCLPYG